MEVWLELLWDTLLDGIKLLPFLFLTYLAMEYLEHAAGEKTEAVVKRSGKLGPLAGGVLGVVPQCGFSAAASNLYAGRVITLGTLIAVYLSTSDEMLPILLMNLQKDNITVGSIAAVVAVKALIGVTAGFVIDLLLRPKQERQIHIHELCEQEHCHCEKGIFVSALTHTLQIFAFILLVSFALAALLHLLGEEFLAYLLLDRPVLGPVLAGVVGLIPNCSASVIITQLYIEGALDLGTMLAGLLVNAGVGLVVLFRVNADKRENGKIIGLLYGIGVGAGILISFVDFALLG